MPKLRATDRVLSEYARLCMAARLQQHLDGGGTSPAAARDEQLLLIIRGIHARLDELEAAAKERATT